MGSNPIRLAISVQNGNYTREIIEETGLFNVSVLTEDVPFEWIKHFGMQSGRDVDKFTDFKQVTRSSNGLLYLKEHTNSMFSAKVTDRIDLGSHTLFVGEVTEAQKLGKETSCTYAYYHQNIKPR